MAVKSSDDEYKGPSKWGNALQKALALDLVSFFTVSLPAMGREFNETGKVAFWSARPGRVIGSVLGWAGLIGGAAWGWNQSKRAEQQHDNLIAERNELKQQVTTLQVSQEAAKSALNGWAGKLGKSSDGTFADKASASVENGPRSVG